MWDSHAATAGDSFAAWNSDADLPHSTGKATSSISQLVARLSLCGIAIRRIIVHCCVTHCSLLRCVATCWTILLVIPTIILPTFMYFLWGTQGSNAYNKELVHALQSFAVDGLKFLDICRYKQWTGTAHFTNPNLFGVVHHEGIMFNTITRGGFRKGFFQVDYGHLGTVYAFYYDFSSVGLYAKSHMAWNWPKRHGCQYQCGKIPVKYQSPLNLVEMFEKYQDWKYNVFWYNCLDFARLVWNWHQPQEVRCLSEREMVLRFNKTMQS